LRFFHFTKVDGVGQVMLDKYAGGRIEVFELLAWYLRRLKANAPKGMPPGWWAYGRYDDGTPIPKPDRTRYRKRTDLATRFPDPFTGFGG